MAAIGTTAVALSTDCSFTPQSNMEAKTFVLVVWFMLGSNLEVVRTESVTQAECITKLEEVLATRRNVSAT